MCDSNSGYKAITLFFYLFCDLVYGGFKVNFVNRALNPINPFNPFNPFNLFNPFVKKP